MRPRRDNRHAPTLETVEAEAAEFRGTLKGLQDDLSLLRGEIAGTARELAAFAERLKRTSTP